MYLEPVDFVGDILLAGIIGGVAAWLIARRMLR